MDISGKRRNSKWHNQLFVELDVIILFVEFDPFHFNLNLVFVLIFYISFLFTMCIFLFDDKCMNEELESPEEKFKVKYCSRTPSRTRDTVDKDDLHSIMVENHFVHCFSLTLLAYKLLSDLIYLCYSGYWLIILCIEWFWNVITYLFDIISFICLISFIVWYHLFVWYHFLCTIVFSCLQLLLCNEESVIWCILHFEKRTRSGTKSSLIKTVKKTHTKKYTRNTRINPCIAL